MVQTSAGVVSTYFPGDGTVLRGNKAHVDVEFLPEFSAMANAEPVAMSSIKGMPRSDTPHELVKGNLDVLDSELIATMHGIKAMGATAATKNGKFSNKALVAESNRLNIRHLQMIRLIPTLMAFPESYFHLHNMFRPFALPQLEARMALQDTYDMQGPFRRLQRTPDSDQAYSEIKFDAPKYAIRVPTPVEDIFRTLINPHEGKLDMMSWARARRHNLEAQKELNKISLTSNIGKIEQLTGTSEQGFHSQNRTNKELVSIVADHLRTHHVQLTHFAMGTELWNEYTQNTWTYNVTGPRPDMIVQGVYKMPGMDGMTAVVDPLLDTTNPNEIFAVAKMEGAWYGQGPMISNTYNDYERDAVVSKTTEFFQYLIVDDSNIIDNDPNTPYTRRFARKINVAT